MIKKIIFMGLLFMLLNAQSPFAAAAEQVVVLPNGLTVLVEEDQRFPLVAIRLYVRAGSAYETEEQAGISHFLEHMVFKGTKKRGPGQVAREVESVGGYINAATSFDYTVYTVDLPDKYWKLGLDIVQDMVFGSTFDPKELDQEKNVVLAELQRGEDNPGQKLFKLIQAKVWAGLPYARPIIGYPQTVKNLSGQDLKSYIRKFYQPRSMLLVVCGNVHKNEVIAQAEKVFGGLNNQETLELSQEFRVKPVQETLNFSEHIQVEHGPWKKVYVNMALPIPGLSSADGPALEVLAYVLGGDMSSKLYRKFKYELQLVDDISCSALMLERAGMLYFNVMLDPDKVEQFWEEFIQEISTLKLKDLPQELIDRAKLNLEDELFQSKETLSGLASKLGYFQFFEGSVQAEEKYLYQLRHVDKKELREVLDKYFRPESFYASLLLPDSVKLDGETFAAYLKKWPGKNEVKQEIVGIETREREILDLGQGRTLVLINDPTLPYTAVSMAWPGGDSLLGSKEQGLAELTAKCLTRGTKNMTAPMIQDFLSDRAAYLSASAGREQFVLTAKFPLRFSQDLYRLLGDVILEPAFETEEVRRAIDDQIAEIKAQEDQPLGYAFRHVFPFLFSKGAYSYFHLGRIEDVQKITKADVARFWEKQKKAPFVLAICGQIDQKALNDFVVRLKQSPVLEVEKGSEFSWSQKRKKNLFLRDRNQTHILQIFPVPGLEDPDSPGLNVLKRVLAGQGGLLFRELRDKQGLCYTVTAILWQTPQTGFLAFYIGTYPEKIDQAEQGFQDIVKMLQQKVLSEEEVNRAKNVYVGEYIRNHQSLGSRSREAASLLVKGLDVDFNKRLIKAIQKIEPEDLKKLARKYLRLDNAYLLRVLPQEEN
ncbi:insulinase family protein [Desulfohalobiaceae bacterium Ax17]|uniref:M16 family metallopeptidase n=1 Tax=Desulfovulcanus ferrireducens TaxID=2831190 RepID=UPI00207BC87E|nr:insulinase family protein [Desulfovulcanus ferrireducens]